MPLRIATDLSQPPHTCLLCSQPPSVCGPCVDTDKDAGLGASRDRVYLCSECIQDCLLVLELPRPKDAEKAIAKAKQYKHKIVDLEQKIVVLTNKLDAASNDLIKSVLGSVAKPAASKPAVKKPASKKPAVKKAS